MVVDKSLWKKFISPTYRLPLFLAVLVVGFWAFYPSGKTALSASGENKAAPVRGAERQHVFDEAGVLPPQSIAKFEQYLEWIFVESDVDIRFLFVPAITGKTIEELAVAKVEELRIGGLGREARGVLLLYDVQAKKLRIEVGYGLEGYFTDAFLSYLTHEHTQTFFASGDLTTGLRLLIRMLHHNIRAAVLGSEFDPRVFDLIRSNRHLSGGGGLTEVMPAGGERGVVFRRELSGAQRTQYVPQPTPRAVYEQYLAWLAAGIFDPRIEIFTEESQSIMASIPVTPAYFHYILMTEYGKTSEIDIRSNIALQYFTDDPLATPHFYRKSERGWQMDMEAEMQNSRNRVGGVYTWDYGGRDDIYTRTFMDKLVNMKNYIRIEGGDNRELPIRN